MSENQESRTFWYRTVVSSFATVLLVLPAFTAGTLAVDWTKDLGIVASSVAYAVASFRLSAVLLSYLMGLLVDRKGAGRCLGVALIGSAVGGLTVSAAPNFGIMLLGFAIGGAANALGQPAVNSFLSSSAYQRLGLSMGIKQAAQPLAAVLASGAALLVGFVIGWRTFFLVSSFLALIVGALFLLRSRHGRSEQRRRHNLTTFSITAPLLLIVVSFAGATTVYTAVLSFFVVYTDSLGRAEGPVLLGIASASAILVRVFLGAGIDRFVRGSAHWMISGLLVGAGSLGVIGLSLDFGPLLGISVIVSLAGAWGFNGVFWYGLVRLAPSAPGAVTGLVAPGAGLGAAFGPILFERLIASLGFQEAWIVLGLLGFISAVAIVWCGYTLDHRYKEPD